MRYATDEVTTLVGNFKPNKQVFIKILDISNDNLVAISTSVCIESRHLPGVYLWRTDNIIDSSLGNGIHNLIYEMTETLSDTKFYGKFVYGGYVDKDVVVDFEPLKDDYSEILENLDIINARL